MGKKGKQRGQIGEISTSEASRAVFFPPPQTTSRLASLAEFFFTNADFSPFPHIVEHGAGLSQFPLFAYPNFKE